MSWNFALILFLLLVLTGAVKIIDRVWLRKARAARAEAEIQRQLKEGVLDADSAEECSRALRNKMNRAPWWVEYAVSFFPVILFVFVLRSFIVEPFRIPSGSMLPTLQSGDLILVNKFSYGIRLPVLDKKVIPLGDPQRGDVVVFRYPVEPQTDYIKRIVGLPGDEVAYINQTLLINGKVVPHVRDGDYYDPERMAYGARYLETLGERKHDILLNENAMPNLSPIWRFPHFDQCRYGREGVRCIVPEGNYFVLGDNRDNSLDSRYWGFVPDENLVGRAFFIWMNFREPSRIGGFK
ncbi:signal peptidase I [Kerstersia gyiorum]|uniref:signal peptidase I n=1 Tax=Kerstersia gyiorum TaxID=206506 RepID=UPI0020A10202|nr:signal peptidase I [Kerstersia gyiorum]MCP1678228.1 signal peptidase I [Kerstersia gyiorum]MCP1821881.1 signal peptidase I [Kerstersia gyiorum]MCP1825305.1 signal peptidase I [Kerstersia gyiorum]MCW2449181.1 signal peptidase I [Kerstersia gyiorum]